MRSCDGPSLKLPLIVKGLKPIGFLYKPKHPMRSTKPYLDTIYDPLVVMARLLPPSLPPSSDLRSTAPHRTCRTVATQHALRLPSGRPGLGPASEDWYCCRCWAQASAIATAGGEAGPQLSRARGWRMGATAEGAQAVGKATCHLQLEPTASSPPAHMGACTRAEAWRYGHEAYPGRQAGSIGQAPTYAA